MPSGSGAFQLDNLFKADYVSTRVGLTYYSLWKTDGRFGLPSLYKVFHSLRNLDKSSWLLNYYLGFFFNRGLIYFWASF